MEIILCIIVLTAAFVLSQWGVIRMTKRACMTVIKDLDAKGAHTPESAVALPYARKKGIFHIGMRDYKPQAIRYLIHKEIIGATDDGRLYLAGDIQDSGEIKL